MRKLVPLLLFGSGFSALIYQIAWIRGLKLVFGASMAATGAVLAIFMGGLGLGSYFLGRLADRHRNPLRLYMKLELGISLLALISPFLILLVQHLYILSGGRESLGFFGSTLLRLFLSALVLGGATTLMGGTLPAASRTIITPADINRKNVALLYGSNTLGAVLGTFLATFFFLEFFGTRNTIFLGVFVNLLVVLGAFFLSRGSKDEPLTLVSTTVRRYVSTSVLSYQRTVVLTVILSSFLVGFLFLLMELIWYRMLVPLLGGSTYTFGLILSTALLGIGLGGIIYTLSPQRRPATLQTLAFTLLLLSFFIILPFALGDNLALKALSFRNSLGTSFGGMVLGWAVITSSILLIPGLISGYQFGLLVSLLGSGERRVGSDVGLLYAFNTLGAIFGSLTGGFLILPILSAKETWRLASFLLLLFGTLVLWYSGTLVRRYDSTIVRWYRRTDVPTYQRTVVLIGIFFLTLFLLFSEGPTAVWRHSQIGAGRVKAEWKTKNEIIEWEITQRRQIEWEEEGREMNVALLKGDGYSFMINGRIDGHCRKDGHTQVLLGLLGGLFHPDPKKGLVIGLGSGSSAGWMGKIKSILKVDVVELEPAILRVAKDCAAANQEVLNNPKVNVILGDGREYLPATKQRFDLIASEPSNPYHAGVATLFTLEFFESVKEKLNEDGLFLQWIPVYTVDAKTVFTLYATLAKVFPHVESWESALLGDLILIASKRPILYDLEKLQKRIKEEPFQEGLLKAWQVENLEGLFARFLGNSSFAKTIALNNKENLNTDDKTLMEYGYARSIGSDKIFRIDGLEKIASDLGLNKTEFVHGSLDWNKVREWHLSLTLFDGRRSAFSSPASGARLKARQAFFEGKIDEVLALWEKQESPPTTLFDILILAETYANRRDAKAEILVQKLLPKRPIEANAILARYLFSKGDLKGATSLLIRAFEGYQKDPWPDPRILSRALQLSSLIAEKSKEAGRILFETLKTPFALKSLEEERIGALGNLAAYVDFDTLCLDVLKEIGRHIHWNHNFLTRRVECYQKNSHPLLEGAIEDFKKFDSHQPTSGRAYR